MSASLNCSAWKLGERLAELLALVQVAARRVERALRGADRAGRDVDAPAVQPLHRDAEALAFAAQQVLGRHAHVVEVDGARGLAVPAHLVFLLAVADAGRVGRHREGRDAARAAAAGARHQHQHVGRRRRRR